MKKIVNWIRDFFYSLTDYALILIIIVLIAVVLIWKFNDLFSLGFDKEAIANNNKSISIVPQDEDNNVNSKTNNKESETSNEDKDTNEKDSNDNQVQDDLTTVEQKEIKINIPAGSYTSQIAEIIVNSGLVENKKVFLSRCSELKLDTKLKAGEFTIKTGTKLDDIIKILTN